MAACLAVAGGASVSAQPEPKPSTITVTGLGSVETPPATATVTFNIYGEGATSDAATANFLAKRKAVEAGLHDLGIPVTAMKSTAFSISSIRGRDCDRDSYSDRAHLSTGACAITGYLAKADFTLVLSPPERAGTVVALAGRLGAGEPQARDFTLEDAADAYHRATARALVNAKGVAEAIASGSGVHLGRLVSVQDGDTRDEDVVVTASRVRMANAPVVVVHEVQLQPKPITTTVRLIVTYAIQP